MDSLTSFVFGILNGVAGNAVYDQLKNILGDKLHYKLEDFAKKDDKEKFITTLDGAVTAKEELKLQIEDLQKGRIINTNYMNNVFGDNVAGNKVVYRK